MNNNSFDFSPDQLSTIEAPINSKIFLEGYAGTGKTTVGVERLRLLLENGIPGNQILLLVPQRTLATSYYDLLHSAETTASGAVTVVTIGGLAKRMVELFWPIAAQQAGFAHPDQQPTFLTLETAQYYMAHLVQPLFGQGFFEAVTIERNRLYSQIIDNLNKAAAVGFPHTDISARLKSAWAGDPGQAHIYEDAQYCATLFREFCLEHNLLDFSLQLEIFSQHIWPSEICRDYLLNNYHHLIVDNLEEDIPVTYDLLNEWLPVFDSALLIFDLEAGYRQFLGADPQSTYTLKDKCDLNPIFSDSFVSSEGVQSFGLALAQTLRFNEPPSIDITNSSFPISYPPLDQTRYYPQMLDWVVDQIEILVDNGVPPGEIVVLSSYLSDALRFSLSERLTERGIPTYSHRPSRSLREEPATQALLTLAAMAHPQWGLQPSKFDLAYTLIQSIADIDLIRAQLLTDIVYQPRRLELSPFAEIKTELQERITFMLGERYERLRAWLSGYTQRQPEELDHFFGRIFGEVLSQPGFGFHSDFDAAEVTANLIESVRKFRWAARDTLLREDVPLGKEYLQMVEDGVIAAQYIFSWGSLPEEAVFLAPAYTFLMRNRSAEYQFWLDIGSRGWYERIRQPLTHPYVLSRGWGLHRPWTDHDEFETSQEALYRLIMGLIRRCQSGIYLGLSELGEQGYEHKGQLLKAIDRALRAVNA
jgi:hypothetical protein